MKEIIEEIVTKSIEHSYEAVDGTIFDDKEECIKYESTAKCALLARYKKLVIKTDYEWDLFGIGSEDYEIDVVKVNTEDDLKCIMQLSYLHSPRWFEDSKNVDKYYNKIQQALNDDNYLYIGRGVEGDLFYALYTYKELQEKLNTSIIVKNETDKA